MIIMMIVIFVLFRWATEPLTPFVRLFTYLHIQISGLRECTLPCAQVKSSFNRHSVCLAPMNLFLFDSPSTSHQMN